MKLAFKKRTAFLSFQSIQYQTDVFVFSFTNFEFKVYKKWLHIVFNTINVKNLPMIWRVWSLGTSLKNKCLRLCLIFDIARVWSKWNQTFFYVNLLRIFCTFWKVLLLWMNSYIYRLNHVYDDACWGCKWLYVFKLLIIFQRRVRFYQSSSNLYIHQYF